MKKLREIHLYLGCLFAPILILFSVTGAWQLFGLHRGRKDGSYRPPHFMRLLSEVHESQHLPGTSHDTGTPLRYFILAAAMGLIVSTILGIVMAFRFGRSRNSVIACLLAGALVPLVLLFVFR